MGVADMSSNWKVLCMSHDPATIISEHSFAAGAEESIKEGYESHPHCDFLVMRVSGGPVEVGCTGLTHPCVGHNETVWVEADWIRILQYLDKEDGTPTEITRLRNKHTLKCWTAERLHRLRYSL